MGKHEINISGLNNKEEQKNENIVNKAIEEVLNEIKTTKIEEEDIDDAYCRNQRGEIKYNQEKSTLKSRGNEAKIEKIFSNGIMKIEGLDFDIPIKEGIRLLNFKNWINYMKKTERKKGNPNIIYSGMNKTEKRRMENNTFYNHDGTRTKLVGRDIIEKYCPTISKDETAMKKIAKRLNNKELTNNEEEYTIESITNNAIGEVFKEILGTELEETRTFFIPAGGAIVPIINNYRDTDTEKEYREERGEIKYDQEKSTFESRGNETKIEKIFENGIIRIEGLDFDIPLKEGIRLLNFKNWIKYMKKTERKEDNPNIIYSGMDETKKRRMQYNTFYNYDGTHTRLLDGDTVEKYCPTISKDENAMKKITKRLNE